MKAKHKKIKTIKATKNHHLPQKLITEVIIVEVITEVEEVEDFQDVEEDVMFHVEVDVEDHQARNGFLKDKHKTIKIKNKLSNSISMMESSIIITRSSSIMQVKKAILESHNIKRRVRIMSDLNSIILIQTVNSRTFGDTIMKRESSRFI